MAKTLVVKGTLPDGFISIEFIDGADKVTVSVPPPANKGDGTDHTEQELLDYLATQWPANAFEAVKAPPRASLAGIRNKSRDVTVRVAAEVVLRAG